MGVDAVAQADGLQSLGLIVLLRGPELWPKLGDGGLRKAAYRGG
jgi:hypothetical protein